MKTYITDCKYTRETVYIQAHNWDEAQDHCFENDLILVGEHELLSEEQARAPIWMTAGETMQ